MKGEDVSFHALGWSKYNGGNSKYQIICCRLFCILIYHIILKACHVLRQYYNIERSLQKCITRNNFTNTVNIGNTNYALYSLIFKNSITLLLI